MKLKFIISTVIFLFWAQDSPASLKISAADFGNLISLDEAIQRVRWDEARIQEVFERLKKEEARYRGTLAQFLPKIGAEFFGAVSTGKEPFVTYADITLEQPLFQGGRAVAGRKKQKARLEIEKLRLDEVKLDLELEVRILYVEILREREMVLIAQNQVKELEIHYSRIRKLLEDEVLTHYELTQLETRLEEARYELVEHKENYDYLLWTLKDILGFSDAEAIELEPLNDIPRLEDQVSKYFDLARLRDPFYRMRGFELEEKEYEKKMIQAERWPQVALAVKGNLYHDEFVDTERVLLGIQGKWNIWDFGELSSEIRAKEHETKELEWKKEAERREKERGVRRLFHLARASLEEIKLKEASLREAREAYKNGKARHIAGETGTFGLLDSFLRQEKARMEHVDAVTEYRLLIIRLERAIGFPARSSAEEKP